MRSLNKSDIIRFYQSSFWKRSCDWPEKFKEFSIDICRKCGVRQVWELQILLAYAYIT